MKREGPRCIGPALGGHIQTILLLLERGADVTAADDSTRAIPFMVAAEHGRDAAIRVLLKHGGSGVNAVDRGRRTACHYAYFRGRSGVLRLLLEAGADPTVRGDSVNGGLPIGLAREWGRQVCITILQEWDRATR